MRRLSVVLILLMLTGCGPSWRSQGLVDLLNSPFYGPLSNYLTYRPLIVQHVNGPTPEGLAAIQAAQRIPRRPLVFDPLLEVW